MPFWNFQNRFRLAIENGIAQAYGGPPIWPEVRPKRQTIRAERKDGRDPIKGDRVKLFVGMRTSGCELLGTTPPLTVADTIYIGERGFVLRDDRRLGRGAITAIARRDGFASADAFFDFFESVHAFPFFGVLYRW